MNFPFPVTQPSQPLKLPETALFVGTFLFVLGRVIWGVIARAMLDEIGVERLRWSSEILETLSIVDENQNRIPGGRGLFPTGLALTIGTWVAIVGIAAFDLVKVWPHRTN